jgi:hypothetical protein
VTREATLFSGAEDRHSAPQASLNGVLTRQLAMMGQLAVGASLSQSGVGSGLPSSASSSFFRWTGLPIVVAGQVLQAETEARVYAATAGDALVSYRVGLATRFANGFDLSASLSRSPFLRSALGRGSYLASVQISTSTDVFSSSRLVTPGVVFVDTDGDGKQGPGEVGVPGVALRYANVRVSTNRHGEYRLPADLRGRVRVDPASLPRGFVAHPRLALDSLERRSIPLVATGTKVVELAVETDGDGRTPEVDLSRATIWLADRDGFEWVGRSVGGGRFTFEHVPAGVYGLRYNVDRLAEQVRIDDVQVTVNAGANEPQFVAVRGRTVRLITPPRNGGRGAGGRGGRSGSNLGGTP